MPNKFPKLMGAIAERGVLKSKIANAMGVSYRAFYNKMTGRSSLTWEEICIIQEQFFPDISKDELFKR